MKTTKVNQQKGRVKEMFKKSREVKNTHINQIYKSDEATRRAIDRLYIQRKMIAVIVFISMFIGVGLGVYVGINMVHTYNQSAVVELKVSSDQLKVNSQSNQ